MSNDVSRNSKIKRKNTMILLSVIIIVVYAFVSTIVLLCMKNTISNEGSIGTTNRLGFLGSHVGGALGGLGTLIVVVIKTEYINKAMELIKCLDEVHNNAGNEHESSDWIEVKTKQLIYEFHKFKQAYVEENDL